MNNKAIIPLYANESLLNNLFTVVVQQFAQTKTISSRNQQVIKINTPLANIIKGSYIQGTCSIELMSEFSNQRTEERVSKIIVVLLETKGILESNNLLKKVNTKEDVENIKENDYIEFQSILNKNSQIQHMENIIKYLEMKNTFCPNCNEEDRISNEVIGRLKGSLEEWKKSKCLKFITSGIAGTNTRAIVPLQLKYMHDSIDDLEDNYVTVMGKVVKGIDRNCDNRNLYSNTYYDFLDDTHFKSFKEKFLKDAPIKGNYQNYIKDQQTSFIEVLPIALYI